MTPDSDKKAFSQNEVAKLILDGLNSQKFEDWHDSDFLAYLEADEGDPTEEEILKDIWDIFKLKGR